LSYLEKQIAAKDLDMAGDQKNEKTKAMKCIRSCKGRERDRVMDQVDIKRKVSDGAQCIHNKRANSDVGHKTTIHDIHMYPVTSCFFHCLYLSPPIVPIHLS
jgi:hypothetical protein